MTTFAIATSILSLALLAGFSALSVRRFGWRKSYSAFAPKWTEAVPIHNAHLWSIVTVAVAFLLCPALLERGAGNPWQFLGFFAPVYLFVVSFTPEYQTDGKQRKIHVYGAISCAAVSLLWIIFVTHLWWVVLIAFFAAWVAAYCTDTLGKSNIFWCEMAFFAATYAAVFIGG